MFMWKCYIAKRFMMMSKDLEKLLEELEKRIKRIVKEAVADELAKHETQSKIRGALTHSPNEPLVSIFRLNIPALTTLLAIAELGGKATIDQITEKTGMARSTEAKNLSILREYQYIDEEKSVAEPRKKIYRITETATRELERLQKEYKEEIKRKRLRSD